MVHGRSKSHRRNNSLISLDSERHYVTNVLLGNEYVMGGGGGGGLCKMHVLSLYSHK